MSSNDVYLLGNNGPDPLYVYPSDTHISALTQYTEDGWSEYVATLSAALSVSRAVEAEQVARSSLTIKHAALVDTEWSADNSQLLTKAVAGSEEWVPTYSRTLELTRSAPAQSEWMPTFSIQITPLVIVVPDTPASITSWAPAPRREVLTQDELRRIREEADLETLILMGVL